MFSFAEKIRRSQLDERFIVVTPKLTFKESAESQVHGLLYTRKIFVAHLMVYTSYISYQEFHAQYPL